MYGGSMTIASTEGGHHVLEVLVSRADALDQLVVQTRLVQQVAGLPPEEYVTEEYLEELHGEMLAAAANLQFERAAQLRDQIAKLQGQPTVAPQVKKRRGRR